LTALSRHDNAGGGRKKGDSTAIIWRTINPKMERRIAATDFSARPLRYS
jgi:hypothetical protein